LYTLTVSRLLPWIGVRGMKVVGATLVGIQLVGVAFGPHWKLQMAGLPVMGLGFYMIHGCLQVFASELSVEAPATDLSPHPVFFFMGQTVGTNALRFGSSTCRQDRNVSLGRRGDGGARIYLREIPEADAAG
ncbi:hypothetical protein, partial [Sphingomonas endophytica]|uniref:hypothetical protein n=1 Tax=Sphingomonas endophytica TaxID=869719 RepID=UPI000A98F545